MRAGEGEATEGIRGWTAAVQLRVDGVGNHSLQKPGYQLRLSEIRRVEIPQLPQVEISLVRFMIICLHVILLLTVNPHRSSSEIR